MKTMVYSLQLTLFLVVLWSLKSGDALRCLSCTGLLHPWLCSTSRKCSDQENACGIRKYNTLNGETLYDVGCITDSLCRSVGGKGNFSDDHPHGNKGQTFCQECCQGEFCNSRGCGSNGYPAKRGPVCFSCTQISDPAKCSTLAFCSESEVCAIFGEHIFDKSIFSSRCSASFECEQPAAGVFGKRQSLDGLCAACCNFDFCNDQCLVERSGNKFITLVKRLLYEFSFMRAQEQMGKNWCTISPHVDSLLVDSTSKFNKGDALPNPGVNNATSPAGTTPASITGNLEFLLMYPYLVDTYDMYIVMLAESAGTAQLEAPYLHMLKNISLKAGRNNFTFNNDMMIEMSFVKNNKGIYLRSSVPLTVWVIFDQAGDDSGHMSTVGYSALPVEKLDKYYKLTTFDSTDQVTIGALSDNTTVIIQCPDNIVINVNGYLCSIHSNATLNINRLEIISFTSGLLTGMAIFSDKNVSVITGNYMHKSGSIFVNIRNSSLIFSPSVEYLPPTRMSDTSFLVPIFPESSINRIYITPFENAATPTIYFTNATGTRRRYSGDIDKFYLDAGPLYIESIQPILLNVKPSKLQGNNLTFGDYSWIPSISQYRNKYLITNVDSIIPGNQSQIVSIILPADQLGGFLINGSQSRPATGHYYLTVKGVSYLFMLLSLNGQFHVIEHSNRSVTFGAFVIGKSKSEGFVGSYIFPAGVS